jgi:hypothetical protein
MAADFIDVSMLMIGALRLPEGDSPMLTHEQ